MSDRSSFERTIHTRRTSQSGRFSTQSCSDTSLPSYCRPVINNAIMTPFSLDFIPPDTASKVRVLFDCCRHFPFKCLAAPKLYEFVISTRSIHRAARYYRSTFNLTARTRVNNRLTHHTCWMLGTAIQWALGSTRSFSC